MSMEEVKQRAYDESTILQEGDGIATIAIPKTEFAAKWWGRGTKWGTAAKEDNCFESYNKEGPLVVIVCPDRSKYQAWCCRNDKFEDALLVNAKDNILTTDSDPNITHLLPIVRWMVGETEKAVEFIPTALKSQISHSRLSDNAQENLAFHLAEAITHSSDAPKM
jgi:hypothetical protein